MDFKLRAVLRLLAASLLGFAVAGCVQVNGDDPSAALRHDGQASRESAVAQSSTVAELEGALDAYSSAQPPDTSAAPPVRQRRLTAAIRGRPLDGGGEALRAHRTAVAKALKEAGYRKVQVVAVDRDGKRTLRATNRTGDRVLVEVSPSGTIVGEYPATAGKPAARPAAMPPAAPPNAPATTTAPPSSVTPDVTAGVTAPPDATAPDSPSPDTPGSDMGVTGTGSETGATDTGSDAGSSDTGSDAGSSDTGSDAGSSDTGSDAGSSDTGSDAGSSDTGSDAGSSDTGSDAGSSDTGSDAGSSDTGSDTGSSDTTGGDTESNDSGSSDSGSADTTGSD